MLNLSNVLDRIKVLNLSNVLNKIKVLQFCTVRWDKGIKAQHC